MNVLIYGLIVPLWLAVAVKAIQVRRSPDEPALRAVLVGVTCLASAVTLAVPPVRAALDAAEPGLPKLLENMVILGASYSILSWLAHRGGVWRTEVLRLLVLTLAETTLVTSWFLMPEAARLDPAGVANADVLGAAVFVWAAVIYMGSGLAISTRYALRYAKVIDRPQRRRGLRVLAAATALLVLVCVAKVATTVARLAGVTADALPVRLGEFFYTAGVGLGTLLFLVGLTYPPLAEMLAALPGWWRRHRAYKELRPLWHLLHEAFPGLALSRMPTSRWLDALRWRRTHRYYYRRIIEIRDGLVQLRPYYASEVADAAAVEAERQGHPAANQKTIVLAAVVLAAARRKAAAEPPVEYPYTADFAGGDDLDSDGAWLSELSRAITTPAAVAAALHDGGGGGSGSPGVLNST